MSIPFRITVCRLGNKAYAGEYIPHHQGAEIRTRDEHPYAYDAIRIFKNAGDVTGSLYTDRLRMWDADKLKRLNEKHFGDQSDYWSERSVEQIEKFLCEWLDKEVVLLEAQEHCNQANGYPCWYFAWGDR